MSGPEFKSNRAAFLKRNDQFIEIVTSHIAIDMDRFLKLSSGMPVDKGQMKAATRAYKTRRGLYRVEINKEYARVQEQGIRTAGKGAPTAPFKNYTTSGTSAGFFHRTISAIIKNRRSYIDEAARALGMR